MQKKHFRHCLRIHRRNINEKFFASLDTESDPRRLFQTIQNHMSRKNQQPLTNYIVYNGVEYRDSSIIDGWAQYFEDLSVPKATAFNIKHLHIIRACQTLSTTSTDEPDLTDAEEIKSIIQRLPVKKAAGPDKLTNEHLKFSGPLLLDILATLFNAILTSGHIPPIFKHGLIIPIPKGHNTDLSNPSNFRGITLLPCISKLFEKVLLN